MRKEDELSEHRCGAYASADSEKAELYGSINIRKDRCAILHVEDAYERHGADDILKEELCGVVGGYAGREYRAGTAGLA